MTFKWEIRRLLGVLHLMILRGASGMRRPWRSLSDQEEGDQKGDSEGGESSREDTETG
jgi:hypothetical protein